MGKDLAQKYEALVEQEDSYFKQIMTSEMCLLAIIDHIFQYGEAFDRTGVKDILESVHEVQLNLRSDLLQLKIEKAFLACEMKKYRLA
jgi:hypothetical protein